MAFRGTFEYTLDAKNRLTVPAKFREPLAGNVVLAKDFERCVALWTRAGYDTFVATTLAARNPASPQARELRRFFAANALDTQLDGANRVMIPSFLLEHAGLERDVVVAGVEDHLEIWDRRAWAEYNASLGPRVIEITAGLDDTSP